jgi:hypothetical protein
MHSQQSKKGIDLQPFSTCGLKLIYLITFYRVLFFPMKLETTLADITPLPHAIRWALDAYRLLF